MVFGLFLNVLGCKSVWPLCTDKQFTLAGCHLKMVMFGNAAGSANWVLRRGLWGLMLVLSVAIYGSHAPLLTQCKVDGMIPFSSASVVVLVELTKLVFSLLFLLTWDRELLGVAVS